MESFQQVDNMLKDFKSLECSSCDQHFGFESRWDSNVHLCSYECLETYNVKFRTRSLPRMRYNSLSSSYGALAEANTNYPQGVAQHHHHGTSVCYGPAPPPPQIFSAYVMPPLPPATFVASGGRLPVPAQTHYQTGHPFAFATYAQSVPPNTVSQHGERGRSRFKIDLTRGGAMNPANDCNQERPKSGTLMKSNVKESHTEEGQQAETVLVDTSIPPPVRQDTPIESLGKKLKEAIRTQKPLKEVQVSQPVTVDVTDLGGLVTGDKERRSFITSAARALLKNPAATSQERTEDSSSLPRTGADDQCLKVVSAVPLETSEVVAGDDSTTTIKIADSAIDIKKKKRMSGSPFILKSTIDISDPVKKVISAVEVEKEKSNPVVSRTAENDNDWRVKGDKSPQTTERRECSRGIDLRDVGASLWLTKKDHAIRPVSPLAISLKTSNSNPAPPPAISEKRIVCSPADKKPRFKYQDMELSANITNNKLGFSVAFVWDNLELTLNARADQPSIKKMQDKIEVFCAKAPPMKSAPEVGEIVFANYQGEFYRAVVTSNRSGDNTFSVDFIDYGDTLEVALKDMRDPDPTIMKQHPAYGLRFVLVPLSNEAKKLGKQDLPEEFWDWVEKWDFFAEVKSVRGSHKWDGKLYHGVKKIDGTLNDVIEDPVMLKEGLFSKSKVPAAEDNKIRETKTADEKDDGRDRDSTSINTQPSNTRSAKPSGVANTSSLSEKAKLSPIAKASTKTESAQLAGKTGEKAMFPGDPQKKVTLPSTQSTMPAATLQSERNVSTVSQKSYCKFAVDSAKWSENFIHGAMVKISFIWNPRELTVNSLDDQERLKKLDGLVKCWVQTAPTMPSMPWVDDIILALYSNGEYYRAVVKKAKKDEVFVHFLDYGDQATVPLSGCRPLSAELEEIPILGLQFTVDGLPEGIGAIVDDRLDKAVECKMQLEKISEITKGRWKGRLWLDAYEHWGGIVAEILEERESKTAV